MLELLSSIVQAEHRRISMSATSLKSTKTTKSADPSPKSQRSDIASTTLSPSGVRLNVNFHSQSNRTEPTESGTQKSHSDLENSELAKDFSGTCLKHSVHDSEESMGGGKEFPLMKSFSMREKSEQLPLYSVEYGTSYEANDTHTEEHSGDSVDYHPPFPGGILRFALDGGVDLKDRYYVRVPKNASADDVAKYMAVAWQRRTPKMILTILSSSEYYQPWDRDRFAEDFQAGLIQAANLTEMWILTEGLDVGMSKLIGDAVFVETTTRRNIERTSMFIKNIQAERLPHLNIFGVVAKSKLLYSELLHDTTVFFNVKRENTDPLFELNPDHTHFIIVDDDCDTDSLSSFRFSLEMRFTKPVGRPRRYRGLFTHEKEGNKKSDTESMLTPIVGILVQGGPPDIEHTLNLLKKKIPVVVVHGSGLAADLVSFAYLEMEEKQDKEYLDGYIKPELLRRLTEAFPQNFANNEIARKECRDKIIECVRNAKQENLTFLIVINAKNPEERLGDLSKYLLMALFMSESIRKDPLWQEQVQWDLQLALDWNRPDLAKSHIFHRYNLDRFRVEDNMFHDALLRPNRESFVDLFLARGMRVHEYLNHKRLLHLFENALDKDFFIGVCQETILRKSLEGKAVCENFIGDADCELNRLLFKCTGLQKLVDPYELSINSLRPCISDWAAAERQAVNALVFWATLTYREEMAKVLWKRTADPIAVALLISMIFNRISEKYCEDVDMKVKVKATAVTFGKIAVEMLNLSYEESSTFTFLLLNKRLEDFNNRTLMELARMSENKHFVAHQCCQKWLGQQWTGNISIREVDWGPFALPDYVKIFLSMFFILPMFVWISFLPTASDRIGQPGAENQEFADEKAEEALFLRMSSVEDEILKRLPKIENRVVHFGKYIKTMLPVYGGEIRLPFWKKIYYLWSAPISKFWLYLVFYVAYLVVYTLALWSPDCGDILMNTIVFFWTFSMWLELICTVYIKYKRNPELKIKFQLLEIGIVLLFLMVFLAMRILPHFINIINFMTAKFLISIGLLFFFYRGMFLFIPVSSDLGPMLINIISMIERDFRTWLQVYLIIAIAGGITIHAVIYPSSDISEETFRRAFKRAVFGVFLTDVSDLDGAECSVLYEKEEIKYCKYNQMNASERALLETCPHKSWNNYFIVGQYLFLVRLILWAVIYAMFSATIGKIRSESVELWKYQRHKVILDFEKRPIFPPPLSLITHAVYLVKGAGQIVWRCFRRCATLCGLCRSKSSISQEKGKMKFRSVKDDFYWKTLINRFVENKEKEKMEDKRAESQSDNLNRIREEVKQQQILGRELNDRIMQLENQFTNTCLLLEEMKHMIEHLNPKTEVLPQEPQKLLHTASRQSPYSGTFIRRYPVFDKYVPWEVPYESYDPVVYTAPVSEFPEDIQMFVDPDVFEIKRLAEQRLQLSPEEQSDLPPLPEFSPVYNTTCIISINGVNAELDRTSWITVDGQPLYYKVDASNIPQNPLGRTGLWGRGKFWRWGPNHKIVAVISRWRRKYSANGHPLGHMVVDGKRVLEFIAVKHPDFGELTLPGGDVYGRTTAYSVLCEEFLKSVFLEEDVEGSLKLDKEDMIRFFAQFARSSKPSDGETSQSSGFTSSILYRGYIDSILNTDNAWREAEVWNFHYNEQDIFDEKIKERAKVWREVTPYMHLHGNLDSIVVIAARIHNAYV